MAARSWRDCHANFECSIAYTYAGGDHVIFVGQVERMACDDAQAAAALLPRRLPPPARPERRNEADAALAAPQRSCSCALLLGVVRPARAETLVENVNETRTYLYFKVADALAQSALPAGWQPAPVPQGPARGANLILVLIERLLATDADRPAARSRRPTACWSWWCPAATGFRTPAARWWSAASRPSPRARPAPTGPMPRARSSSCASSRDGVVDEDWEAESPDGDRLALGLSYVQGLPAC